MLSEIFCNSLHPSAIIDLIYLGPPSQYRHLAVRCAQMGCPEAGFHRPSDRKIVALPLNAWLTTRVRSHALSSFEDDLPSEGS